MESLKQKSLQMVFNTAFGGHRYNNLVVVRAAQTYSFVPQPSSWLETMDGMYFDVMPAEIKAELLKRVGDHFKVRLDENHQIVEDISNDPGLGRASRGVELKTEGWWEPIVNWAFILFLAFSVAYTSAMLFGKVFKIFS